MSIQLHKRISLVLKKLSNFKVISTYNVTRCISTRDTEAIFVQKNIEVPIVTVTERNNVDIIGPPDPLSNLRPIIRKRNLNETVLQTRLRELQDETQEWNKKFWAEHNTSFLKEKSDYIKSRLKTNEETISADKMSEFYKTFLDNNWSKHCNYNMEWYRRNFLILLLSLRVSIQNILRIV